MNLNSLLTRIPSIIETESSLRINGIPHSERVFEFVKFASKTVMYSRAFKFSIITDYGDDLDLETEFDQEVFTDNVSIKIEKAYDKHRAYFFTQKAFDAYVSGTNNLSKNVILIFTNYGFTTESIRFWDRSGLYVNIVEQSHAANLIEPIKLVKPLNNQAVKFLPDNLNDWLLLKGELLSNTYFPPESWLKVSCLKCLVSVASEFFIDDNQIHLFFSGAKRRELIVNLNNFNVDKNGFSAFQTVLRWIYSETQDVDLKYSLLNNQIALIDDSDLVDLTTSTDKLSRVVDKVLSNSKLAYSFHLSKISKDLHKSLSELNKNLIDNLQKARQNTTDLISSLWRDFTTVFALLLLNFSIKKPELSPLYWDIAFVSLILYLLISLGLTSSTGFWFFKKLKESVAALKNTVYSYMSNADYESYASRPLNNALFRYKIVFWIIAFSYLAIIIAIYFALKIQLPSNLGNPFKLI